MFFKQIAQKPIKEIISKSTLFQPNDKSGKKCNLKFYKNL